MVRDRPRIHRHHYLAGHLIIFLSHFRQYHHNWKEGHYGDYPSVVQFLEELCEKKIIHAYGFTLDLEPFNHHTPALGGYT